MKSLRLPAPSLPRLLAFAALLLFGSGLVARAQHVQASLVAAEQSVQPGRPLTVALRLQHDPHWHTYWLNPGTGLPTTLAWTLPAGWTAGEIQWPAPKVIVDASATVTGNGYEGDLLLPVTLTPPADLAPGATVTLAAEAEWLMCADVCVPGSASVSLTLPVTAAAPAADPSFGPRLAAVVAALPRADAAWTVAATRTAKAVTLTVTPAAGATITHTPAGLHFFADDNLVAYELPQAIAPDGRGGFGLTLSVDPAAPTDATALHGVLTASNGWRADGTLPGLRIDTPFAAATRTISPPLNAGPTQLSAPGSQLSSLNSQHQPPTSLLGTLLLALVGGLILNLMPCVFPVLGLKILGFVNQAGSDRRKVIAHGLVFTLGVLLSFWTLAGALAALRAGGDQLGWGFQLQSPAFVFALAVLLLGFALNMSGVFEFGLRATSVGSGLQTKDGYAGSFFTGVLATVVATPCSAPFLAPALGAALALPVGESFLIFTAIGVGLSTPYLLLSIFPAAVKVLPRPGAWMETFKQFMAFPLYATVGYLVWVLAGQTSESGLLMVLFGLVLIALGVWLYGRWNAPGASAGRARFGLLAGLLALAAGLWTGWPQPPAPSDIVWEKWSPETVAKLRAENRLVYVDFTARWCATCQANKKLVFASAAVRQTFAARKVVALKADWTNKDPHITAELASYGRSAVPFNVVWRPGQPEPVILPELLTPGIVLDALKE